MLTESTTTLDERTSYYQEPAFASEQRHIPTRTHFSNTQQQSKFYSSMIGANPLLAAASPILSLVGRLYTASVLQDLSELYLDLIHEINAFENQAERFNYRHETIVIARYILAATLDEVIIKKEPRWQNSQLLNFFQQDDVSGERFFLILERLSEEPAFYIDLLELIYVCLSLGYEGKFRQQLGAHHTLNTLRHEVFYKLCQIKRELRPSLNTTKQLTYQKSRVKFQTILLPTKWFLLSAGLTVAIIVSSFTTQQWQGLNPIRLFIS